MAFSPQSIKASRSASDPDETTALLAVSKHDPAILVNEEAVAHETHLNGASPEDSDDKPLPRTQTFLLCYARLVEPIAFFSIFPFINKMIWETGGLDEADVGFYSGLIVCGTHSHSLQRSSTTCYGHMQCM